MEWERRVFGPIMDELVFKPGGINSGDLYIIYNNSFKLPKIWAKEYLLDQLMWGLSARLL